MNLITLNLDKQVLDSNGYYYVYAPTHPQANGAGKVYVHRYIGYLKEGRVLSTDEECHHIDENKINNSINNIEVMTHIEHILLHSSKPIIACGVCSRPTKGIKYCSNKCSGIASRKLDIKAEVLHKLVWTMPIRDVAKLYNVSDVTLNKYCKRLNIEKPPRGYWLRASNSR